MCKLLKNNVRFATLRRQPATSHVEVWYSWLRNKRIGVGNKEGMGKLLRTKNKQGLENLAHLSLNKEGMGRILRTKISRGWKN